MSQENVKTALTFKMEVTGPKSPPNEALVLKSVRNGKNFDTLTLDVLIDSGSSSLDELLRATHLRERCSQYGKREIAWSALITSQDLCQHLFQQL
jgi:hypothetical protein